MVVYAYYPWDESRVQREAKALVEMGHKVDVLCLRKKGEPSKGSEGGVNFYRLPVQRYYSKNLIAQLTGYFVFFVFSFLWLAKNGNRYKNIHFHTPPDAIVFAGLIPKLFGKRIILDIHDLQPELYMAKFGKSPIIKKLIVIEKLSCLFTDNVITVTKIWCNRLWERGVSKNKCNVIMNLPDEKVFYPRQKVKKGTGLNLVYHGTLVKRYGVDIGIKAVSIVKNSIPDIKFNVIGAGEELDNLIKLASELGVTDNVYFSKKFVPVNELPDILSNMDVGIIGNRNDCFTSEVFNAKLQEYMALGIPIIASQTIGIKQYLDEQSVLFFTPESEKELAEKIIYLYNNPVKRQEFASNARKFFISHNWKTESQKLKIYCR